jgi:uncharacterized FlaG/YvyC family protein
MQIDPIAPIMMMPGVSGVGAEPKPPGSGTVPDAFGKQPRAEPDSLSAGSSAHSKETEQALHQFNLAIEPFNVSLKFTKDQDSGTMVIQMIDQKTGDTLQQLPSAASLHVAATLSKFQGRIFSRKA